MKRQKNDMADAEATCQAVPRPTMRFVPAKSPERQSVMVLYRTRSILSRWRHRDRSRLSAEIDELGKCGQDAMRQPVEHMAAPIRLNRTSDQPLPTRSRPHMAALLTVTRRSSWAAEIQRLRAMQECPLCC